MFSPQLSQVSHTNSCGEEERTSCRQSGLATKETLTRGPGSSPAPRRAPARRPGQPFPAMRLAAPRCSRASAGRGAQEQRLLPPRPPRRASGPPRPPASTRQLREAEKSRGPRAAGGGLVRGEPPGGRRGGLPRRILSPLSLLPLPAGCQQPSAARRGLGAPRERSPAPPQPGPTFPGRRPLRHRLGPFPSRRPAPAPLPLPLPVPAPSPRPGAGPRGPARSPRRARGSRTSLLKAFTASMSRRGRGRAASRG